MGKIIEINGPIVTVELPRVRNGEQVRIGKLGLIGEVIGREGDNAIVQVYETTESVRPGEGVEPLGHPLSVELGPGLLGQIEVRAGETADLDRSGLTIRHRR